MFRSLMCALFVVGLCAFTVLAKEYKGTVTKIDTDKNTITVKVDGKETTFVTNDKTTFLAGNGKEIPKERLAKMAEKLGNKGRPATIESVEKDGKEVLKGDKPVAAKVTFKGGKKKNN